MNIIRAVYWMYVKTSWFSTSPNNSWCIRKIRSLALQQPTAIQVAKVKGETMCSYEQYKVLTQRFWTTSQPRYITDQWDINNLGKNNFSTNLYPKNDNKPQQDAPENWTSSSSSVDDELAKTDSIQPILYINILFLKGPMSHRVEMFHLKIIFRH